MHAGERFRDDEARGAVLTGAGDRAVLGPSRWTGLYKPSIGTGNPRGGSAIGLVNELVPSGTCLERAPELARELAALPQPALRTDREAAVRGFGIFHPEAVDGLRRFTERDHPDRLRGGVTGRT